MRRRLGWGMRICVSVLRPFARLVTRQDWRGAENIPKSGGCVIVTNHISEFDPVPVAHFVYDSGRVPRFLAKVEVFKLPVVGAILRNAGQIPVHRRSADAAKAYGAAVAAVENGECVVVYVEGTITRDPGLWPMVGRTGAARIALSTGCPVIPLAHWGAQDLLAPYARRPHLLPRKVVHMSVGPPVDLSDLTADAPTPTQLREATSRIIAAITAQLAVVRGETPPVEPFDMRAGGAA